MQTSLNVFKYLKSKYVKTLHCLFVIALFTGFTIYTYLTIHLMLFPSSFFFGGGDGGGGGANKL